MTHPMTKLDRLADRLLGPDGCPWDKAQTPEKLSGYLIEEAAEASQAILEGEADEAKEELGDLLYLIVFACRLYQDQGLFDLSQVVETVEEKMIRRHPHIFGQEKLDTPKAVKAKWDQIKRGEKGGPASVLDSLPRSLPGLLKAHRLSQRAATIGFDWDSPAKVMEKVEEEMGELKAALEQGSGHAVEAEELGDLLFSLANLSRHLGFNPETVIQQANLKFMNRFKEMENVFLSAGKDPAQADAREMDAVWEEVKRRR